jgi:poly(3-hydroxybutyrate) depolymerase
MAAVADDLVAAVCCMALYLITPVASNYSAVPIMEVHGINDKGEGTGGVPYEGMLTDPFYKTALNPYSIDGAVTNTDNWATLNGCVGAPVVIDNADMITRSYDTCEKRSKVKLVVPKDAAHRPYLGGGNGGGETKLDTTTMMWDFVKQFEKPVAPSIEAVAYFNSAPSIAAAAGVILALFCLLMAVY